MSKEAKTEKNESTNKTPDAQPSETQAGTDETLSQQASAPEGDAVDFEPVDAAEDFKAQLDGMNDKYVRLMAEFDNYKKRVSRDYERLVESANEKLMVEMVAVRENFERALKAGQSGGEFQSFYDGMKLIFSSFESVLASQGLEVFAEAGEAFDPQVHDALMKTPHATIDEDHIAEVFEHGYKLKGRVIKHARVIVSGGKPASAESESSES